MLLQFETVVATGSATLDSGIGDTALKTFNGDTYVYSVTGPFGGVAVWRLVEGAAPQLVDTELHGGSIIYQVGRFGVPVTLGGQVKLVLDVNTATGLVSYDLNADGTVGALTETGTLTGGGDISSLAQTSLGTTDLLVVAHDKTGQIGTYRINPDGTLSVAGLVTADADAMHIAEIDGGRFVITSDAASDALRVFSVNQSTGVLTAIDNSDTTATVGIDAPTAVEIVEAHGNSWLIVAGSGSNSLSVMEVASDGRLIPTDHVLDTLDTRFEAVQDIAVIDIAGHIYVAAGGRDDGISLFTLSPDGQLIHLDSFADTLDSGLENVQTVNLAHIGDELQIIASAQGDPGLTLLSKSVANLGVVREGVGTVTGTAQNDMLSGSVFASTLLGGDGDDILISGPAATRMTGGSGADIFVMQYGSEPTTITDFQAGIDRLDLFDYPLLRSPAQVQVTATLTGADIRYMDEVVHIESATGETLSSADIFGAGFGGPDHIPVDFGDFGGLQPDSSDGVLGTVTVNPQTANPGLTDAQIRFTPSDGGSISASADTDGRFDFDLPSGTFTGNVDILKSYSTASQKITALDALQVLRISVGLDPTWGPAAPENLIAADITQDGTVNALDALSILQAAVGQPSAHEAKWIFLDADQDLSAITRNTVSYDTGADVTIVDGAFSVDMTSILLGNLEPV
ncbi:MAG: dockerin type I domain-containing protein [Pseudomonadota bacterium]